MVKKQKRSATKSPRTNHRANGHPGPLESLVLKDHCEMCGVSKRHVSSVVREKMMPLEPAFDPSGRAKTLCQPCRIGSAELLADRRIKFSTRHTDTIIAALRLWQRAPQYPEIELTEEHGKMLSDKEIDSLIETQLNA
jgi:hypothetical protein